MKTPIGILIEDYTRRLATINTLIKESTFEDQKKRLKIKAGFCRALLHELELAAAEEKEFAAECFAAGNKFDDFDVYFEEKYNEPSKIIFTRQEVVEKIKKLDVDASSDGDTTVGKEYLKDWLKTNL